MSITLDTAVSPTDAHPAYESVRLHTSAPPPSRQTRDTRYNSRAASRIFLPRQASVTTSQSQPLSPAPGTENGLDTTHNHTNQSDQYQPQQHIEPQVQIADIEEVHDGQDHDRMDAEMEGDEIPLARDSADVGAPIASAAGEVAVMDTIMDAAPDIVPLEAGNLPPPPPLPPLRTSDGWGRSPATTGTTTVEGTTEDDGQDDEIDDQDSEDSVSTDEPHNFHTNSNTFKEDETSPDEEELREILELGEETNAEDRK